MAQYAMALMILGVIITIANLVVLFCKGANWLIEKITEWRENKSSQFNNNKNVKNGSNTT